MGQNNVEEVLRSIAYLSLTVMLTICFYYGQRGHASFECIEDAHPYPSTLTTTSHATLAATSHATSSKHHIGHDNGW